MKANIMPVTAEKLIKRGLLASVFAIGGIAAVNAQEPFGDEPIRSDVSPEESYHFEDYPTYETHERLGSFGFGSRAEVDFMPSAAQIEHVRELAEDLIQEINIKNLRHLESVKARTVEGDGRILPMADGIFKVLAQPIQPNFYNSNDFATIDSLVYPKELQHMWNQVGDGTMTQDEFDQGFAHYLQRSISPASFTRSTVDYTYDIVNGRLCVDISRHAKDCFAVEEVRADTPRGNDIKAIHEAFPQQAAKLGLDL